MYAGLTPTLIRAFPANAAQWLAWELSRRCNTYDYCLLALRAALGSLTTSSIDMNSCFHVLFTAHITCVMRSHADTRAEVWHIAFGRQLQPLMAS